MKNNYFAICLAVLFSAGVQAELSARQIMEKVDQNVRQSNDSAFSVSVLSSCRFVQRDRQVVCSDQPRVKKLETVSKQYGRQLKDSRVISVVLEPAADRGVGMLTYSYDDDQKDTESWLYLSALGKVKRLASGDDDKEPVAFFGSEFTTEDMESGKTDEYDYRILQQGQYGQRPVWVVEATPTAARRNKTRYSKVLMWVDKERFLVIKAQPFDKQGKAWKRIIARDIEQVAGHWIARDAQVFNMKSRRMSRLITEAITLGVAVDDEFLTQRTLTDKAFREQGLARLRAAAVQ